MVHKLIYLKNYIKMDSNWVIIKEIQLDILADYMISSISYKSLIWYHISGLYDIEQNIPINYNLVTHKNERKALIEQLVHYKGDILVSMVIIVQN